MEKKDNKITSLADYRHSKVKKKYDEMTVDERIDEIMSEIIEEIGVRYECPCGNEMWGERSGLGIICGDCNQKFEQMDRKLTH